MEDLSKEKTTICDMANKLMKNLCYYTICKTVSCLKSKKIHCKFSLFHVLILSLSSLFGVQVIVHIVWCAVDKWKWSGQGEKNKQRKRRYWMKHIPDSTPISKLSIPGTHDSMCYEGQRRWFNFTTCQNWTLTMQLDVGIRFFDIRCVMRNGTIELYHGPFALNKIDNHVVKPIKEFLEHEDGKSDFIIMRIKQECHIQQDFGEILFKADGCFKELQEFLWKPTKENTTCIPELSDVRQKVIVLRDFQTDESENVKTYGFSFCDKQCISLSDEFVVNESYLNTMLGRFENKSRYVENHLLKAGINVKKWTKKAIHFTFTTANSVSNWTNLLSLPVLLLGNPRTVAGYMNKQLNEFLQDYNTMCTCGVVVMDFPSVKLVDRIIDMQMDIGPSVEEMSRKKKWATLLREHLNTILEHWLDVVDQYNNNAPINIINDLCSGYIIHRPKDAEEYTKLFNNQGLIGGLHQLLLIGLRKEQPIDIEKLLFYIADKNESFKPILEDIMNNFDLTMD